MALMMSVHKQLLDLSFARKFFDASAVQWKRGTLFDRRVHGNYRRARSRRPLTRCLDDKSIASLIFGLRLVFVTSRVELFFNLPWTGF